jgi:hypothetical protein
VRVNFPRKKASKEIRTIPQVSCDRTEEDWTNKSWTASFEADYYGSNADQKKIG